MANAKARLFVISAPSGSGKSSICQKVMAQRPSLIYSVSYTTRSARPGEVNGRDYNFIDNAIFDQMIAEGEFLEWANIFDQRYGTGKKWVFDHLSQGRDVIADVDILGAGAIKKNYPEAILIFIVPPSLLELERRLTARQTESNEQIKKRLARSLEEISARHIYHYLIINDDLNKAAEQLKALVDGQSLPPLSAQENFWPKFFQDSPELLAKI